MDNKFLVTGAVLGGVAVIIGAFGAHALKALLVENDTVQTFQTGSLYHLTHSIALSFTGYLYSINKHKWLKWANISLIAGIFFFSGSLYTLSITGIKQMGAIAPIGGIFLISGWACLLLYALRKN
ncbi:MAG: DUF423 domain-containing protein [Cyclobacteriaceae bacterium]